MNIVFCGQKGGTGKTTIAYLVAESLSRVGKRVAVQDVDPQKSLTKIIEDQRTAGKTALEIWEQRHADSCDFTIVDTLPRLSSRELQPILRRADRVLVPLTPSMIDVHATRPVIEMVKATMKETAKALIVWNRVKPGTKISAQLDVLAASLELEALKTQIPERIGYSYSVFQGVQVLAPVERDAIQQVVIELLS